MIYNMLQILSKYSTFSYRGGLCPPRTPYEHVQSYCTHARETRARAHFGISLTLLRWDFCAIVVSLYNFSL